MLIVAVCWFVTVAVCDALLLPTATLPKCSRSGKIASPVFVLIDSELSSINASLSCNWFLMKFIVYVMDRVPTGIAYTPDPFVHVPLWLSTVLVVTVLIEALFPSRKVSVTEPSSLGVPWFSPCSQKLTFANSVPPSTCAAVMPVPCATIDTVCDSESVPLFVPPTKS